MNKQLVYKNDSKNILFSKAPSEKYCMCECFFSPFRPVRVITAPKYKSTFRHTPVTRGKSLHFHHGLSLVRAFHMHQKNFNIFFSITTQRIFFLTNQSVTKLKIYPDHARERRRLNTDLSFHVKTFDSCTWSIDLEKQPKVNTSKTSRNYPIIK